MGQLLKVTVFLCLSDLGQLISLRLTQHCWPGQVQNEIDAFCLFPGLILRFSFLKWALLNFLAVLFPLPHPQSEAFVEHPIVGYQSDKAWFMYQYQAAHRSAH